VSGEGARSVTVSVPATSANLGPGFDALGLALELRDEVVVELRPGAAEPVVVEVSGEGEDDLPRDRSHLVVATMRRVAAAVGADLPPVRLRCTNRIPHGRGLGSSAAATTAGVLAARELLSLDLDADAVLQWASDIEGHPDNAAACLLGGVTVAWSQTGRVRALRLDPADELCATAYVPTHRLATSEARGLLPASVPFADAAHNAARSALLTAALTSSPELLLPATDDRLHQHYRAKAMPASLELVHRLRAAGAAAVVSGAGPTVLTLAAGRGEDVVVPAGWEVLDLDVARIGAIIT
jgi:homoserine kinase